MFHPVICAGLCALVFLLPLPFGSTEEWALAAFQVSVFALAGLHLIGDEKRNGIRAPLYLKIPLGIFLAVSLLQIIPLPPALVRSLSAGAFNAQERAFSILGPSGRMTLSLSPAATVYELLKYASYFVFAFLVFRHIRTRRETNAFILALLAAGVFESAYGLIELFGGTQKIFGFTRDYHLGSATGTFINRDHFSGFLEMIFPLALGYLLSQTDFFGFEKEMTFKRRLLWFSQERFQKTILFAVAAVIIGLGIVFSRSRTGIFILFATVFLMITFLSASAIGKRKRLASILRTVLLFIVSGALLIGSKSVIERFSWENLKREERPVFFRNTLALIGSHAAFGTGPGTFADTYQAFERKASTGLLDHAHNDYLEVLAESGITGGGSLILCALGTWIFLFVRWMGRRDNFDRGIVLGCILGIAAILVHSLTDFNLRIPSNAATFAALYALALGKTLRHGNAGDKN